MKKSFLLFLSLAFPLAARDELASILDFDLEDLSQITVDTSTVSNRYELGLDQAAGSVTVVTAEEIERHGYKTLQELLNTVVGFDEGYHIYRSLVSNRGFRQDINSNYLLIVDGHRVNEDAYGGFDMAHIFPLMSNIKRVEIIRGPSSTLWGSSAINGIIAVTTKNAEDYAGSTKTAGTARVSVDYETKNERIVVNADYARSVEGTQVLLSAQYFDNDAPWGTVYGYGVPAEVPYKKPQAQYDYLPSHRLYAKIEHGDLTLLANHTYYGDIPNNITFRYPTRTRDEWARTRQTWFDLLYTPRLSSSLSLESRIFYDYKTIQQYSEWLSGETFRDQRYIDRGVGGEAILHHTDAAGHFLAGIYAHRKRLEAHYQVSQHERITDKNVALFAEYTYDGIDDWLVTVGGRAEYGSPRGTRRTYLPRASVYWQVRDDLFLKYSYNTGALRPTLVTMRDYYYTSGDTTYYAKGADSSQKSYSHDLQAGFRGETLHVTATLFYSRIEDLILWGDQYRAGTLNGVPVLLWETNLAEIAQKGFELEWRWFGAENFVVYGNYSYADTRYTHEWVEYNGQPVLNLVDDMYTDDSLVMAGAPRHTWNLGVDWDVASDVSLNLHYRGRSGVLSIYPDPEWKRYGAEHFLDTNLRWIRPFGKDMELDFYVKNLTDNRGPFPMGYGEVETQLGRQVGAQLKMAF